MNKIYEDYVDIIDEEIRKRSNKWRLKAAPYIDFDDVSQIIRAHIYKKWHLWDQSRPFKPWVNRVISNQIKNILRSHYKNYIKPCFSCEHNLNEFDDRGRELCSFTPSGEQCSECPLFEKWERSKRNSSNVRLPVSLFSEVNNDENTYYEDPATWVLPEDTKNIENSIDKLHEKMRETLSDGNFFVYKMLYIDNLDEDFVADVLGFKTKKKGRGSKCRRQIKFLKSYFLKVAQKVSKEIDIM